LCRKPRTRSSKFLEGRELAGLCGAQRESDDEHPAPHCSRSADIGGTKKTTREARASSDIGASFKAEDAALDLHCADERDVRCEDISV